jgi:hypothetical protein
MFVSIDAQSPYLDFYPRAQRVTVSFDICLVAFIDQVVLNLIFALEPLGLSSDLFSFFDPVPTASLSIGVVASEHNN